MANAGELPVEQLLQRIVDALYLCIVVDSSCTVRYISRAYAEIIGMGAEQIVGKDVRAILPNTRMPEIVKSGKPILGDIFIMPNGEATVCNRFPILADDGGVLGAFSTATFQDLDVIGQLNDKLEELRRENKIYKKQLQRLRQKEFSLDSVIGAAPSILEIKQTITQVANSALTVLITGETGVGKEVFAAALHNLSSRRFGPYIKVNCAAIPKDLLESELFGYAGGAFTGAAKGGKAGKFEQANHGTILLDEIAELPLPLQSKLLRVLQEREVERVGGARPIKLDVRVICSTNQNVAEMAAQGKFRQDLLYRINVVELCIPPLRERMEDIPALCQFFVQKINSIHGCAISGISDAVLKLFYQYAWPGNVRELEHVLERASVTALSGQLDVADFHFFLPRIQPEQAPPSGALHDERQRAEIAAIESALSRSNWNKTEAARLLKIPRSLLYEKLKRYGIKREQG